MAGDGPFSWPTYGREAGGRRPSRRDEMVVVMGDGKLHEPVVFVSTWRVHIAHALRFCRVWRRSCSRFGQLVKMW